MTTAASAGTGTLAHPAFFYHSPADYTHGITGFLHDGLTAGEPALVAVPGPNLTLIRDALNGTADGVAFLDMAALGANPARIIPAIRQFTSTHAGQRTRFVGEPIWPGRTPTELAEATRHEALLNLAFADVPVTILCPYDATGLDPAVLADAARTHPAIRQHGQHQHSPGYDGPALAAALAAQPLPAPPGDAAVLGFGHTGDLPAVRRHVSQHAMRAGLDNDRTQDLTVAVNELATNTLRHGAGPGTLRTWHDTSTGTLTCEVTGPGHITDPLAGRYPPGTSPSGGHGLWLVSQLCDLTELRTGPGGTTTRLHTHTR